jgi:hypothetical protein
MSPGTILAILIGLIVAVLAVAFLAKLLFFRDPIEDADDPNRWDDQIGRRL